MQEIHIKLETYEAIDSERNMLSSQINLLNIIKRMQNYSGLRTREMIKKSRLKSKLKEINLTINNIKKILPRVSIPKIEGEENIVIEKTKRNKLEHDLEDIRERLSELSG